VGKIDAMSVVMTYKGPYGIETKFPGRVLPYGLV
jgi:hypothetical protein